MKINLSRLVLARCAGVVGIVLSLASASPLLAASASELLEQGIYSEETKGDLDGAMKLYQEVVAEGKAGEALAAQAQYRLATCYYKKKQFTEASTAFEKLLQDFPNQKELVARAQEYLAGTVTLLPAPWADGEELIADLKLATGFKLGTVRTRINSGETNGHKIWRLSTYLYAGVAQLSQVEVEADSFRPLHSRWKHTLLGDADAVYTPRSATIKLVGKDKPITVELAGLVYDNEEAIQLLRRLPLATNYSTSIRIFTSLGGGNIIPTKITVPALETVVVPAGSFECYKVELSLAGMSLKQAFWYSSDAHRYLVKFEANGVAAELTSINQHQPGEAVKYKDETFALSAPSDWLFFRPDTKSGKSKALLYIIDPEGIATGELWVRPLSKLKAEEQTSLRACADQFLAGRADEHDFTVRTDSWQPRSVDGQPGISFIADYTESEVKKVAYGVCSFGKTNAVQFLLQVPADSFEALRPQFDTIVDSYRGK
jgi:hypothetical protein